jgi:autotransporter adhesin
MTLMLALLAAMAAVSAPAWAGNTCTLGGGGVGGSSSPGLGATACGNHDTASGEFSSAFGYDSTAEGLFSNAVGSYNAASGWNSSAFGSGLNGGYFNRASGDYSSAFGFYNLAQGRSSSAFGSLAQTGVGADDSIAFGAGSVNFLNQQSRKDGAVVANGVTSAIAIGHTVNVSANDGVAIGHDSAVQAGATGAVALGSGSVADTANTFSIGSDTLQRRIVNVAAGTADTDAVNLSQLETVTAAFGGGGSFAGGVFTAPTFTIQGTSYNNVGAAFDAVDASITDLYAKVANAGGTQGPPGPPGPAGPQGPAGPAGGGPREVVYDQDAGDTLTLKGANGTVISHVAAGKASTDAANVSQVDEALQSAKTYADAGDSRTLAQANAYTDSKLAAGFVTEQTFTQFQQQVDERFHQVDVRMARIGALGQAMGGMAGAIAGGDRTNNRVSAALGSYGGQNAMAVGYSHLLPGHGSVLVGGSVASGGETGGTVGVSFGW